MATAEAPSRPQGRPTATSWRASATSRSSIVRWEASPRSRPGSATSRSSPASRRCSRRATSTRDRECGGHGRSCSGVRSWWRCASWRWPRQYPIAGSVYQWSKQISSGYTAWMTGWIYIVGAIVTIAAVAVDWQVVLPQISNSLQFAGSSADAGLTSTKGGAQNALLLGTILVVITTIINMLGVKLMARINNVGVAAELIGSSHPDHPARVPPPPRPRRHLPLLRLRRRPSLGFLRCAADRRAAERVHDVRVRHRRDSG